MKLPDLSEQARPTPSPSMGVAQYQTEDIRAAVAPGNAMSEFGDQLGRMAQEEQKRIDTLRAEDALNQLRSKQQDLTMGENGFLQQKGSAAVTKPLMKTYSTQFDDATNQIIQTLGSNQQKEMFRARANMAALQFRDDLMRHIVREGDVYEDQTFKGAASVEGANVAAHWNEPDSVNLSLERMRGLVTQRAQSKGWGSLSDHDSYASAVLKQELGNLHESVIDQALANKNYVMAEKWFDDHKSEMDAQTIDRLSVKVENGVQKQLTNDYNTQFLASRDNPKLLNELEKSVAGDKNLDDDRKNMLLGRIQSRSEVLANRAERAAAQQDRRLQQGITAMNALSLQGYEPTVEQMQPLVDMAKGTAYEPMVKQMLAVADTTRAFRLSTPAQQEQYLTQLEARARQDPTKFDVTMISRLRTIHDNQQQALKTDPTSFAVRQGLVAPDDISAKPLDLTKPETLGDALQHRFDLARSMQSRYGAPMKPLTEAEANLISSSLANAPAQARRDYLSRLAAVTQNDRAGYTAIMAQIAPDDPVTAIAGLRAIKDPGAADLLIQGQSILHPPKKADGTPENGKLWPMPKQADMDIQFRAKEGDAFAGSPQVRNAYYQATTSIYAALAAKAGNSSGVIDTDLFKKAFNMATGGIERYNGKSVVLPYGMTKGDFKDGLSTRLDVIANSGNMVKGMTVDKLKDLPLESIGEGKYVLRAGDGVVVDKKKKRVVIDFNSPAIVESELVRQIHK